MNRYRDSPLQILVIEDNKDHAFLTLKTLTKAFPKSKVSIAENGGQALQNLHQQPFDIILSDYNLPDKDGLAILKEIKAHGFDVPFVMLTGAGDERVAVEAMQVGAYDYLVKDEVYLSSLPKVIQETLIKCDDRKEKERLQREITEKNQELERVNRELRKLDQLKSEFIASVSHEFRTPLNAIKESVALFADGIVRLGEKQGTRVLEIANNNLDRLTMLINDLLDISKLEAGRMRIEKKDHDMAEIINEVIDSMRPTAAKKGIQLSLTVTDGPHPVVVDKGRIVQVLMNLVDNAIKFTPPDGSIKISCGKNGERIVKVQVQDSGIGIAEQNLRRIFGKFEQVREQQTGTEIRGTGLGLAISKELIELHEGLIWAESELGKGSRFIFTIPRY